MLRGIDHIVHTVRDLDAAVEFYRGLGFTVGARNRHPPAWGTENHIIQLPGFFIELLAVTSPSEIAPHEPQRFSFGAFNRDFLTRGEGLSMMVLSSENAKHDAEEFRGARIGDFSVFEFSREARRPDGTTVNVAFSLAFARDDAAPDTGFFVCQQHYPENFWNPAFQKHANTAQGIAGVVAVSNEPVQHREFLEKFTGSKATEIDGGFRIVTARGEIDIIKPAKFVERYGIVAPDVSRGLRLAALRISVADASLLQSVPELAGIAGLYAGNIAVVGPVAGRGAVLAFESAR